MEAQLMQQVHRCLCPSSTGRQRTTLNNFLQLQLQQTCIKLLRSCMDAKPNIPAMHLSQYRKIPDESIVFVVSAIQLVTAFFLAQGLHAGLSTGHASRHDGHGAHAGSHLQAPVLVPGCAACHPTFERLQYCIHCGRPAAPCSTVPDRHFKSRKQQPGTSAAAADPTLQACLSMLEYMLLYWTIVHKQAHARMNLACLFWFFELVYLAMPKYHLHRLHQASHHISNILAASCSSPLHAYPAYHWGATPMT